MLTVGCFLIRHYKLNDKKFLQNIKEISERTYLD